MTLYQLTDEFKALEQTLIAAHGVIDDETDVQLTELMQATDEKLDGYLMIRANFKALAAASKAEADRLAKRSKTMLNIVKSLEDRLANHFIATDQDAVDRPLGKIRLVTSGTAAFEVTAEIDALPNRYVKTVRTKVVDKEELKIALKSGNKRMRNAASKYARFLPKKRSIRVY